LPNFPLNHHFSAATAFALLNLLANVPSFCWAQGYGQLLLCAYFLGIINEEFAGSSYGASPYGAMGLGNSGYGGGYG
jgi:hypothetical protein